MTERRAIRSTHIGDISSNGDGETNLQPVAFVGGALKGGSRRLTQQQADICEDCAAIATEQCESKINWFKIACQSKTNYEMRLRALVLLLLSPQVDGVRNAKVHSIFFEDLPITNAVFTTADQVCSPA